MMNAPLILSYGDKTPRIHSSAWIAPGAIIIGDVEIGADSSVFYGSVLRGDVAAIRIGERTNIQDNSTVHVDRGVPTILGNDVTVGHMALVHGTTVEDGCLIGMKSTLLSRSRIGTGSLIAAGAVVLEDQIIEPGSLTAGVPAKVRRQLTAEESDGFIAHAGRYVETASQHRFLDPVDLDMVTFN